IRVSAAVDTASNAAVNFGVPVPAQEFEAVCLVFNVHQQVAGLLDHPLTRGMGGDPGEAPAANAVLIKNSTYRRRRSTVSTGKQPPPSWRGRPDRPPWALVPMCGESPEQDVVHRAGVLDGRRADLPPVGCQNCARDL